MFEYSWNTRKQHVWICRKIQGNKVFQSAEIFKETIRLNLMENERKQGVSICRKMQGNKVFQSVGKCRETNGFPTVENTRKQSVSICRNIQGNNTFETIRLNLMENERKQGVSICREMQANKVSQSAGKCRETMCFKLLKTQVNKVLRSSVCISHTRTPTFELWSHEFKLWTPPGWTFFLNNFLI